MTPREMFEAIWSGDEARWPAAWAFLLKTVRYCGAPGLADGSDATVEDAAMTFLSQASDDGTRAALLSVQTKSGLQTAARQILKRARGATIEQHPRPFYEHLHEKVRRVLTKDARFERFTEETPRRFRLVGVPVATHGVSDEAIDAGLPVLEGRYLVTQDNHFPEVVDRAALVDQLERILKLAGNRAMTVHGLTVHAYTSIHPSPDEATLLPLAPQPALSGGRAGPADVAAPTVSDPLATRDAAVLAHEFVSRLPSRTRAAVWLKYCCAQELSLDEIASRLKEAGFKASRGTAANEIGETEGRIKRDLATFIKHRDLDEEDASRLLQKVLEIVDAAGFPGTEDSHD